MHALFSAPQSASHIIHKKHGSLTSRSHTGAGSGTRPQTLEYHGPYAFHTKTKSAVNLQKKKKTATYKILCAMQQTAQLSNHENQEWWVHTGHVGHPLLSY